MKRLFILLSLSFCGFAYAETINLGWYKDGELYAQTNCEVGSGVTLPNEPSKKGYDFVGWSEIFDRGTFANWESVTTAELGYTKDSYDSKVPNENDYIIITNASDFTNNVCFVSDGTTLYWNVEGVKGSELISNISSDQRNVGEFNSVGFRNGGNRLYLYVNKANYYKSSPSATSYIGTALYNQAISAKFTKIIYTDPIGYSGTWRFKYSGDWSKDKKCGWIPEKRLD